MHDEDEVLREAVLAFQQADCLYQERELEAARLCYRKALALAARTRRRDFEAACQYGLAATSMQLGMLRAALEALAPIVRDAGQLDADTLFMAQMELAAVAQQIPIEVSRVQAIYRELWGSVHGDPVREAEVLVFRSRHLLYRGLPGEARRAAEAALKQKIAAGDAGEEQGQVYDYHYYGLCGIALAEGDVDRSRAVLEQWSEAPDQLPPNRWLRMSRAQAEIALAEGDTEAAAQAAEHAREAALLTDYEEVTGPVHWTRLRIAWARDDPDAAAEALTDLLRYRNSERRILRQSVLAALALERTRRGRPPSAPRERRRRREAEELGGLLQNHAWADADHIPILWI